MANDPQQAAKQRAAEAALGYVRPGMRLGLGSGTTAELVVKALAGWRVTCVPTSQRTAELARAAGIPVEDFTHGTRLDLAIDGADEVADDLGLIKGHGGALLYEKIVASAADRFIVVADATKRVRRLGAAYLPVEVVPFALPRVAEALTQLGAQVKPRDFTTQAGNKILDATFGPMADPAALAAHLDAMPGVVEHGLFLGMAHLAIIATPDAVEILESPTP